VCLNLQSLRFQHQLLEPLAREVEVEVVLGLV
jgi:hypothetical protein